MSISKCSLQSKNQTTANNLVSQMTLQKTLKRPK
jgi:hypothetical protein